MKKTRFTEEQIIAALREVESGKTTGVAKSRELGVAEATFYKWKKQYGGLDVHEAKAAA